MYKRKVYISSTLDISEFRQAIIDVINKNNVWFELLNIAEFMTNSSKPPLKICKEQVADSDVYILIFGHRYGTVIEDGKSYTHLEYLEAVKYKKEIFVLYADEALPDLHPETEYPDKFIAFRNEALSPKSRYTREAFKSVGGLREQLYQLFFEKVMESVPIVNEQELLYKCDRVPETESYVYYLVELEQTAVAASFHYGRIVDVPQDFSRKLVTKLGDVVFFKFDIGNLLVASNDERKWLGKMLLSSVQTIRPEYGTGKGLLDPKLKKLTSSVASFVEFAGSQEISGFYLLLVVDRSLLAETEKIVRLVNHLTTSIKEANIKDKLFHVVISVQGADPFVNIKKEYEALTSRFSDCLDLHELKMIKRQHIKDWLREGLEIDTEFYLEKLTDENFGINDFEIDLMNAQDIMRKLIRKQFIKLK
jgi:hypothetical protein